MMVSFDVISLFTSIPPALAIDTIDGFLREKHDETDQQLKRVHIFELLELCLKAFFTFNGQVYEQKKRTPMGSPLSGLIAEAFFQRLERLVFSSYPPKFWAGYVGDTFVIIKRNDVQTFKALLNSILPDIQFTMEEKLYSQLAFLDIQVTKLEDGKIRTTVYPYLRFAAFIFALFICITGLLSNFSDLPNQPAKSKNSATAVTNNIVLMVIDALRADMISSPKYSANWPMLKRIMRQGIVECSTATLSSPTVTSPRIKTISTGRLSEFLDAIYNTQSAAVTHDSWVRRLAERRKRLEMYGDNTWLRLFPRTFARADGTSSFFVNDFYEVDSNVTRHLDDRIPAVTEWDVMVLHFLGLDHIGHVEGPLGTHIAPKLREMDEVVWKVYQHLLQLPQHGVNAENSGPSENFRVRDPVLPSQLQYPVEAYEMKVVEFLGMVGVDGPSLRTV
ncbi:hypothetical protein SprV_0301135900 [Sparganum proliferum]